MNNIYIFLHFLYSILTYILILCKMFILFGMTPSLLPTLPPLLSRPPFFVVPFLFFSHDVMRSGYVIETLRLFKPYFGLPT